MPSTRAAIARSGQGWICSTRSSSFCGPCHTTSTFPRSSATPFAGGDEVDRLPEDVRSPLRDPVRTPHFFLRRAERAVAADVLFLRRLSSGRRSSGHRRSPFEVAVSPVATTGSTFFFSRQSTSRLTPRAHPCESGFWTTSPSILPRLQCGSRSGSLRNRTRREVDLPALGFRHRPRPASIVRR